jgi:hypothetical protein
VNSDIESLERTLSSSPVRTILGAAVGTSRNSCDRCGSKGAGSARDGS